MFAMAAAILAACSKDMTEDTVGTSGSATANSLLQVTTRGTNDATVAYPVQVYVFQGEGSGGSGAECLAVQTIGDAGQALNIALTEGTYSVYAVGGASSSDFTLPAKDEATTSTVIALKEGRTLTDLMAASATATLTDGGTNTVTLGMQRKTMLIQDITISKIPSAATAVSVTIAPLWQSLTIGGTYSTVGQTTTIALTKQEDGRTWKNSAGSVFLLPPSSQPASISVNITVGGATNTYTYSTSDQLEAGYKINISGTYTEAVGVNLTGTITGATWLGERTISFTFDESGSTAVNTGSGSGEANGGSGGSEAGSAAANVPAVGDTYLGCYVLAVDDAEDHAEVLVVAPADITGTFYGSGADNAVATALGTVTVDGISGWEVPDRDQASLIFNARGSIGGLTHNSYLCLNNGYKCFFVGGGATAFTPTYSPNDQTDTALRPVATVTIAKE